MKKLLLLSFTVIAIMLASHSCRMAPSRDLGDTVSAKVFEPIDTTGRALLAKKNDTTKVIDSTDIFFIGKGSNRSEVQLVSYPSRRDTTTCYKSRHLKVVGNADYNHVVRAKFWVSNNCDTLITRLEEIKDSALSVVSRPN